MLYNILYYLDIFGFFTYEEVQPEQKKKFIVKKATPDTNIHDELQKELKTYFKNRNYQSKL